MTNDAARQSVAEFALSNGDAEAWNPTEPAVDEWRAKVESFKYVEGGGHRSELFPGYLIRPRVIGPVGYYVFRDGERGPVTDTFTFDMAVSFISTTASTGA